MVSNMEKHHTFKSLFEYNVIQVSSIVLNAHLCTLSDIVHNFPQHIHSVASNHGEQAIAPL
jgi:hypothetical protein